MDAESVIAVHVDGIQNELIINKDGEYPVYLRNEKIQITREEGQSPITVFAEMDYASGPAK